MVPTMFHKQHPDVGARPGTLVISDDAPEPRIRVMRFGTEGFVENDISDIDSIEEPNDETVTWIDVQGLGNEQTLRAIAQRFGFHDLLLEDVVHVPQRPKAETYDNQLSLIVRMLSSQEADDIQLEQVSIVLGENYVITFQERYGDVLEPVRNRIRSQRAPIKKRKADYLAYALADTIIDAYYPVIELIGERIEMLNDNVMENPTPELLHTLNGLKNQLVNIRRSVFPQQEALSSLCRGDHRMISEEVRLYFRDTYDHCIQTTDVTEMYREMVAGLMNTYLTVVANKTNDVMKLLTIVSTIFIPITFVAGIYGMNFQNMPELQSKYGYAIVWLVMLGTTAGLLWYFRRKHWL